MAKMWWPRRRRDIRHRPFRDADIADPGKPAVDDSVDEGLLLAEVAARLEVHNRILVGVVGRSDNFDADDFIPFASERLGELAEEQRRMARRFRMEARQAERMRDSPSHAHDYTVDDADNLRHHASVAEAVAERLEAMAIDEEFLGAIVERSRLDAWNDIERSIVSRIDGEVAARTLAKKEGSRKHAGRLASLRAELSLMSAEAPE